MVKTRYRVIVNNFFDSNHAEFDHAWDLGVKIKSESPEKNVVVEQTEYEPVVKASFDVGLKSIES